MNSLFRRIATSASFRRRLVATRLRHGGRRPPVCEDVSAWAVRHQHATPLTLAPPQTVRLRLPRTIEPELLDVYTERVEIPIPGRSLVAVAGARILGAEGLVVLPDGSYSAESVLGRSNLEQRIDYFAPPGRPTIRRPGDYFALLDFITPGHYYHWLHDTLSRLYGVREHLPSGTRIIVSPRLTDLQRDTLRMIGVRDDDLVHFDPSQVWRLETLHFVPAPTWSGTSLPEVDRWLRDVILGDFGIVPEAAGRRIYISRSGMTNRRVANEAALMDFLADFGFEACAPETLPLRRQAELFAGAEIVVSTHCSAFTNMLFSPPGLRIVDMVPPSMFTNAFAFWTMAEQLGHEYWYFVADDVDVPGALQPDASVPLEKLRATFDRMGILPTR